MPANHTDLEKSSSLIFLRYADFKFTQAHVVSEHVE
jgi:hypothetical protein